MVPPQTIALGRKQVSAAKVVARFRDESTTAVVVGTPAHVVVAGCRLQELAPDEFLSGTDAYGAFVL